MEGTPVTLAVDVGILDVPVAGRIGRALSDQMPKVLRRKGLSIVTEDEVALLELRVDLPDPDLREYLISVKITMNEAQAGESLADWRTCLACTELGVVDETLALVSSLVSRLPEPEPESKLAPPPILELEPEPSPAPAQRGRRRGLKLGPLGLTSVAAIVGGLASAGAGGLLIDLGTDDTSLYSHHGLDPRLVGMSLVGGGAGVAVLGAVCLVVDVEVLERRRQRRFDLSIEVSPSSAGLWMTGSF
ncbi:hypothetical protein ENSA5_23760 [Enhygromyxa salina]|uniref:Uncharacterized protein n=1 Tax=Enhygromyxa salina TaxID=215803 RepID=A0A2S9YB78_9BACT|nr:hypothetical protein [Enhygromyxa salina]PRQ02359.1 hypothetical protein ENSA5_23760 [Enhygromyxa salina]